MQLFILLYIEAGSYLQEDEDQWEFVVLCVSLISLFIPHTLLDLRNASGKEANMFTISSGTPPCIRSIIIPTAHGCD
jgi:hypothetical protein